MTDWGFQPVLETSDDAKSLWTTSRHFAEDTKHNDDVEKESLKVQDVFCASYVNVLLVLAFLILIGFVLYLLFIRISRGSSITAEHTKLEERVNLDRAVAQYTQRVRGSSL